MNYFLWSRLKEYRTLQHENKLTYLIIIMYEKANFFVSAILTAVFVQAKENTIVINTHSELSKGNTEVKVEDSPTGDVITITPAEESTTITITVKNEYGEVISENDIPATTDGVYEVTTPENNEGGTIEVSDDNGLVYSDFQ